LEDASRGDLLALIAQLQTVNAALMARIAQQDEVIAAQGVRIAALEKALSRNSGNSSMPPSTDDLPGRGKPALHDPGCSRGLNPPVSRSDLAM
jgi:hypothetical protein